MSHRIAVLISTAVLAGCATAPARPVPQTDDPHLALAYRVLSTTPLIDGHNDLPWAIRGYDEAPRDVAAYDLRQRTPGHTDLERLRQGMVGAQFWSVYVPFSAVDEGAAKVQLEQIDIAHRIIQRYPDAFELALTTDDVMRIFNDGKIASMLGMEGGHAIENSLGALRSFYDLGARYMTLTHSANIDWADSCCEAPEHGGLTRFGEEVVGEMNWLGMLVDLSHVSPETMHDALNVAQAPVIYSHSSARAVTDVPRNVPDDVLRRLPENGGVVMVTFVRSFVTDDPDNATMADVVRHLEHVRAVAGIDHVGLGSDYDGATLPQGLEDVSTFPALFAELARRGWTEPELRKLAGENVLRAWRQAEAVAARLRAARPASTATIEELDATVTARTGAFVTRLGVDTLVVETFRIEPTSFEAEVVQRSPRTRLLSYRGQLDHEGNLRSLTVLELDPANPDADPIERVTYRFGRANTVVMRRGDDGPAVDTLDVRGGPLPFLDMVYWPLELALARLAGTGRDSATFRFLQGPEATPLAVTLSDRGAVTAAHPFRTIRGAAGDEGRLLEVDAGGGLRSERVSALDVRALATSFAARDARGAGVGQLSGRGEARAEVGGGDVVIDYGRPWKRGRVIFGSLVPYGEVWRTGANDATTLTTVRALRIGGARIPAGVYSLSTIPGRDGWTLIVTREAGMEGMPAEPATEVARIPMQVRALAEPEEQLTIRIDPDAQGAVLRIRWDRTEAFVPIRP